jgi:hypothetical protein
MLHGAASGTSRRAFLGRAAGAAAAVAGAGIGAGALAGSAAAAGQRTYTAGRFALELGGLPCGRLSGVDGGDLGGNVVLDKVGSDQIQRKHIAGIKWESFTVQAGSGMDTTFYNWIKDSFDKGVVRQSGAIVAGDFNWNEKRRASISQAAISSVTFPALDGSSKDPAYLAVDISPTDVKSPPPSGQPIQGGQQKAWLPSNFVFEIGGVDTSRVASVDSFTWKCTVAPDGSLVMDVSDIGVTFPRSSLASWQRWYDSLVSGADDERDGALTLVGAHEGAVVTVGLYNLGVHRLSPQPGYAGRMKAEMYCERCSWDLKQGTKV